MHLCVTAVRTQPQLRVWHPLQELLYFLLFVLFISNYFQFVYCLEQLCFLSLELSYSISYFVEDLFQSELLLLLVQRGTAFYLLNLLDPPILQFLNKHFEILLALGMNSPGDVHFLVCLIMFPLFLLVAEFDQFVLLLERKQVFSPHSG